MPDEVTFRLPSSTKAQWIILAAVTNLTLFAIGIYTWVTTSTLHLPLSPILPVIGTLLPLINLSGLSHALSKPTSKLVARTATPLRTAFPIFLLLLLDTVLLTLSSTHVSPSTCELQQKWMGMFRAHNKGAIKGIQDALLCCGFKNNKDMAFPFPVKGAVTCFEQTGRTQGCEGAWRQKEQVQATLLMLVGGVLVVMKVVSLVMLQRGAEKAQRTRDMEDEAARERRVEEIESEFGDEERGGRGLGATERTPLIHDSPWAENGVNGAEQREREAAADQH